MGREWGFAEPEAFRGVPDGERKARSSQTIEHFVTGDTPAEAVAGYAP